MYYVIYNLYVLSKTLLFMTQFMTNIIFYDNKLLTCIASQKCNSKLSCSAGHCTLAGCMTRMLRHVAEAFLPARQGTILNNHRVIGIAAKTIMILNCGLVTYLMMTADVGLPDVV